MTETEYKQIAKRFRKEIDVQLKSMSKADSKFDYDNACIKVLDRLNSFTDLIEEFRQNWAENNDKEREVKE